MIMSYSERKSAVLEDFEDFHSNMGYSLKAALCAAIGEAAYSRLYTQTDTLCICTAFALILIGRGEDLSFLRAAWEELADERYMPQYARELGTEFPLLQKDLQYVRKHFV